MRALPAGIGVRRATPGDEPAVHRFVLAGIDAYRDWAPHWRPIPPSRAARRRIAGNFDDERVWILLAERGAELVGVVSLSDKTMAAADAPPAGTIYLWQMFVRRDHQGSGLAGALMDRAVQEARDRGFSRITLWTPAGAAQARRFYEREGFVLSGNEDPESAFGLPLVEYERAIDAGRRRGSDPPRDGARY